MATKNAIVLKKEVQLLQKELLIKLRQVQITLKLVIRQLQRSLLKLETVIN